MMAAPHTTHRFYYMLPPLLVLLAALFFFQSPGRDERFHPDEAFFMTFARAAAVNGLWLLPGPLDKPPLTLYSSALALTFWGVQPDAQGVLHLDVLRGERAVRLLNLLAALALTAAVYALARALYRRRDVALLAMLFVALSPLLVAFSATAFTDVQMLLAAVLALWAAARGHGGLAGLLLALALACKPQGLLYLPLAAALLWEKGRWPALLRCGGALLAGVALLLLWDAARPETSIFVLGAAHNAPVTLLAPLDKLPGRLAEWLSYSGTLLGPPALTAALLLVSFAAALRRRALRTDRMLAGWLLLYVALHLLPDASIHDRYLLLALPPAALLAARVCAPLLERGRVRRLALAGLFVLLAAGAWQARGGLLHVGGDRGQHSGINRLADYLNSLHVAAVIYDPWLGWELGYYMGEWTDKRRVHYPTPQALAAGAAALPETDPRYFVAPQQTAPNAWLAALARAGFCHRMAYRADGFVVYELIPFPAVWGASAAGAFWPAPAVADARAASWHCGCQSPCSRSPRPR